MTMKEMNHNESKDASTKRNKLAKSHNNQSLKNNNEEFASEIGIENNSDEQKPVSERTAWN